MGKSIKSRHYQKIIWEKVADGNASKRDVFTEMVADGRSSKRGNIYEKVASGSASKGDVFTKMVADGRGSKHDIFTEKSQMEVLPSVTYLHKRAKGPRWDWVSPDNNVVVTAWVHGLKGFDMQPIVL